MAFRWKDADIQLWGDTSYSMERNDAKIPGQDGNVKRIDAMKWIFQHLAEKFAETDPDGLLIGTFGMGAQVLAEGVKTGTEAASIIESANMSGATDLHTAIQVFEQKRIPGKPTLGVFFTDGDPGSSSKRQAVIQEIKNIAAKCAPSPADATLTDDVALLFIQVGYDETSTAYLKHLDDEIDAKFDIVDAQTAEDIEGKDIYEIIAKAFID